MRNLNVAVREWEDEVVFLHKIVAGAADKSYGIHVARLAGVPREVLERAKQILAQLEQEHVDEEGRSKLARQEPNPRPRGRPATHALRRRRSSAGRRVAQDRPRRSDAAGGVELVAEVARRQSSDVSRRHAQFGDVVEPAFGIRCDAASSRSRPILLFPPICAVCEL